ncbi:MAG: 16S rRNA (guanine(966)-N(2))-methyltransferase RsmD [Candidatus Dactylopiibacterium sp.]|nr:16S rRNA (guanine(966)-N(2))-methyltransferase RsmD [Candidatus Dactylopiibacterium sp.]
MSKVRIVGGSHRSRLIEVPDSAGLRPTPDRVRETLFNWLGQDLAGWRCLDLFSGSGVLGFEAASRGAREVVMVESAARVMANLRATQARLALPGVRLVAGDALRYLGGAPGLFDLILLDPPYRQGWLDRVAPLLADALAPEAFVYVEAEEAVAALAGLEPVRQGKAGQVHYQLFKKPAPGISA